MNTVLLKTSVGLCFKLRLHILMMTIFFFFFIKNRHQLRHEEECYKQNILIGVEEKDVAGGMLCADLKKMK